MNRARLALCALLCMQSTAMSIEPFFPRPTGHHQIPLEKEFKRLISGKGRKEPVLAGLLATVPPFFAIQGLGQVYNGEVGKGLFFLSIGQVSFSTWKTAVDPMSIKIARAAYLGTWAYSIIDAWRSAKRINRKRGHPFVRPSLTRASAYAGRRSP